MDDGSQLAAMLFVISLILVGISAIIEYSFGLNFGHFSIFYGSRLLDN